jgi:hypothetical protein
MQLGAGALLLLLDAVMQVVDDHAGQPLVMHKEALAAFQLPTF